MRQVLALAAVALIVAAAPAGEAKAPPLRVCLVAACEEYHADVSLGEFRKHLEATGRAACTMVVGKDVGQGLPGIEAINACDVVLLFARRVTLTDEQLRCVQAYCRAGKPIVGVRTASHAFQNWLAFDKEVLGGNYLGHYGVGPKAQVKIEDRAKDHPVLAGFKPFASAYSLYKNTGLAEDAQVLLTATSGGQTEPVAWTRVHNGGRIFYTSLGGPDDFKDAGFRQMLTSALFWTAGRDVEKK